VPQTNSENRTLSDQAPQFLVEVGKGAGVTWTVGQKHSIRLQSQNIVGFCRGGKNRDPEPVLAQPSPNFELYAVVVGNNSMLDRWESLENLAIFGNGVDLVARTLDDCPVTA